MTLREPTAAMVAAVLALGLGACSASDPVCGNGIRELGELCDDANKADGDGCTPSCLTEDESGCGDGHVSGGEECDDGNGVSGDGCASNCWYEVLPGCGDGIRAIAEECDDANIDKGDGCNARCAREDAVPACGNGLLDPDETCDDANRRAGDGCDAACAREPGNCGDGVLNQDEDCDDANKADGDGCTARCRREGGMCGDLAVDSGETCDDGNTTSGDGCSPSCRTERCGDGSVLGGEDCDDGNTASGDGCSANCGLEVAAGCGNGVLEAGEECDDGGRDSGDGCSSACERELAGICEADAVLTCNSTDTWSTLGSGSTQDVSAYACAPWLESGREYTYTFVAPSSGQVTVSLRGTASDLDLFVLSEADDACLPDDCVGAGDHSATFEAEAGEVYYVVVDGYQGAVGSFSIELACGACGDGTVDPGEACDDGNAAAGDGCDDHCQLEGCGDGGLDAGEECDDGNTASGDGCDAICRAEACGNGRVDTGEECDDGNTIPGDGCSAGCRSEGGQCTAPIDMACGETDTWYTAGSGSTDVVDAYVCSPWNESGREYGYRFIAQQTAWVTASLFDMSADLDLFVLSTQCDGDRCIGVGNTAVTFYVTAGTTYYLIVDGYAGAQGNFSLELSCGGGTCGDRVVNAGEQCDDGNWNNGDGCDSYCLYE